MGVPSYIRIIKRVLGNPLARLALTRLSFRERTIALKHFYEGTYPKSLRIAAGVKVMELVAKTAEKLRGVNEREIRNAFGKPSVRRGRAMVLRSLGEYGITVPQKLIAPFLVVRNYTNMCNLRCKHCYQNAGKPLPDELTREERLNVIEQLDETGVAAIALSGGEPTIHPTFLDAVREFHKRGFYVSVASNGTTITKEKAKAMKEAGVDYVEISVDSVDPKKHDEFRGVPGARERAIEGIKNSLAAGITTGIATTLTKANLDEIEDMVELALKLGVQRLIFFNFVPVGRGKEILSRDPSPEEREKALIKIAELMMKYKDRLMIATTAPQYARVTLQISGGKIVAGTHFTPPDLEVASALAEFLGGCGAGRIYCALQPNGAVTPCVFFPYVVGNVRKTHFKKIRRESELFKLLRDRDNPNYACSKCPYRYICGGCRARAFNITGDPLGPDVGCPIAKAFMRAAQATK